MAAMLENGTGEDISTAKNDGYVAPKNIDFRFMDEGLGGQGKRKRAREEEESSAAKFHEIQAAKRSAVAMDEDSSTPVSKPIVNASPTYDGVMAGRVSGRNWKTPRTSRASALRGKAGKPLSLDQKIKEREVKKAYKIRKAELKEEIRQNKVNKRQAAVDRKKKKEENTQKSGMKLQKITNPKTLKKLSKKQRKQLKVVSE